MHTIQMNLIHSYVEKEILVEIILGRGFELPTRG